jgi:hypothetical protein
MTKFLPTIHPDISKTKPKLGLNILSKLWTRWSSIFILEQCIWSQGEFPSETSRLCPSTDVTSTPFSYKRVLIWYNSWFIYDQKSQITPSRQLWSHSDSMVIYNNTTQSMS